MIVGHIEEALQDWNALCVCKIGLCVWRGCLEVILEKQRWGNSYFSVLILIFIPIEVSFLVWGKGETWWNVNFRKINEAWCHVETFTWERTKLVPMGTTVSGIKRAEKGLTYFRPRREYEVWTWVVEVIAIHLLKWKWIGPFGWGRGERKRHDLLALVLGSSVGGEVIYYLHLLCWHLLNTFSWWRRKGYGGNSFKEEVLKGRKGRHVKI